MKILAAFKGRLISIAQFIKPSFVPAAIATAVILLAAFIIENQNQRTFHNELKANVTSELNLVKTRLRGEINANVAVIRSFANTLSATPDLPQALFDMQANKLLMQNPQLLRLSTAPKAVITMVFPHRGNEQMIGTDFKRFKSSRLAMDMARNLLRPIIAGPVRLPSGESGFTLFFPVFTKRTGISTFWGFIEGVIDEKRLYQDADVYHSDAEPSEADHSHTHFHIDISMRDVSVKTSILDPFYGNADIFDRQPILQELEFPGGKWEMAAVPAAGWNQQPGNTNELRIMMAIAGFMIILPIILTGGFVNERQQNVAKIRARERQLVMLSNRLDLALDASKIGVWEIDVAADLHDWDDRMSSLHGFAAERGQRTHAQWLAGIHPGDLDETAALLQQTKERGIDFRAQYRIVLPDGTVRHLRSVGSAHKDVLGVTRITGISWDVTDDVLMTEQLRKAKLLADAKNEELEYANDRIEYNALHDPLTDLGNRRKLDRELERLAASDEYGATDIAVLHIDLDRFKQINDTLGHAAGDAMLVHASQILRNNVRENDLIARIGGDEFVIVVTDAKNKAYLTGIAERIIVEMRQPVNYNGFPCRFGVSIGIAIGKGSNLDPRTLLINADIALYRAKERGRNRHEFFTQALQSEITTTKRIADEILEGIENDQFIPWYQPQIAAGTLELEGLEALVRWNHPREGLLTPDRFLKIAEEMNMMATLDRIVLEKALVHRLRWAAAGMIVPRISVNVSAKRLRDENLVDSLQGLNFAAGQISFELVESIFLDESDDVVTRNIEKIKALGIDIEIDDFGTGHTSIVSLLKIKPKRLKIDRQLVSPILSSKHERSVVRSIIEIGRSLNIEIVAEGVETMQHAELLSALGCQLLQGYTFAKPLSPEAVLEFAAGRQWRKAS
ncbi:bifunctional diguanylate cyclase/phosphodiesterase [Pararhizobium sp.]|uniref:bifunctional diguanylate cyclase/phosphodiesterase n=1 Tax=Pararhizobium sp. TaxID=1977563 RepID=UPI00272933F3|nr:EAL domain-containing protein [Pararhizobium sp.]MDO9415748.1 EAL domain-containing protein [Pararhizobium sp.]